MRRLRPLGVLVGAAILISMSAWLDAQTTSATPPRVAAGVIARRAAITGAWDYNALESVNAANGRPEQSPKSATTRTPGARPPRTRVAGAPDGAFRPPQRVIRCRCVAIGSHRLLFLIAAGDSRLCCPINAVSSHCIRPHPAIISIHLNERCLTTWGRGGLDFGVGQIQVAMISLLLRSPRRVIRVAGQLRGARRVQGHAD